MQKQFNKHLTTLTTLTIVLIFKTFGVVSSIAANLPQYLPQPATQRMWKGVTTLNLLYYNKLQACGKW